MNLINGVRAAAACRRVMVPRILGCAEMAVLCPLRLGKYYCRTGVGQWRSLSPLVGSPGSMRSRRSRRAGRWDEMGARGETRKRAHTTKHHEKKRDAEEGDKKGRLQSRLLLSSALTVRKSDVERLRRAPHAGLERAGREEKAGFRWGRVHLPPTSLFSWLS